MTSPSIRIGRKFKRLLGIVGLILAALGVVDIPEQFRTWRGLLADWISRLNEANVKMAMLAVGLCVALWGFGALDRLVPVLVSRRRQLERLTVFANEGRSLWHGLEKGQEEQPSEEDVDKWVRSLRQFVDTYLGKARAERLSNLHGITFYGDGSSRSDLRNKLDGILQRLGELIDRLSD